jgi:chromosome segregation ATPase
MRQAQAALAAARALGNTRLDAIAAEDLALRGAVAKAQAELTELRTREHDLRTSLHGRQAAELAARQEISAQLQPLQETRRQLEQEAAAARLGAARARAALLEGRAQLQSSHQEARDLRDEELARGKLEREFDAARNAGAGLLARLNRETAAQAAQQAALAALQAEHARLEQELAQARAHDEELRASLRFANLALEEQRQARAEAPLGFAADGASTAVLFDDGSDAPAAPQHQPAALRIDHTQHAAATAARVTEARLRADVLASTAFQQELRASQAALEEQANALYLAQQSAHGDLDQRLAAARAAQESLAEEEKILLAQNQELQQRCEATLATQDDLHAELRDLEELAERLRQDRDETSAAHQVTSTGLDEQRAATAQLRDEAARLVQEADEAQAAHAAARERLRGVQQQNAELENDRIRTLARIKETKARMQQAEQDEAKLAGKAPRGGLRISAMGVGLAFAALAAAVYVVPRYWSPTVEPVAQGTPAPASPLAAPAVQAKPIYDADPAASRDLHLSFELRPTGTPAATSAPPPAPKPAAP